MSNAVLEFSGMLKALLTWPKFSRTSFNMVSDLNLQGINPNTVIDVGANVGQFAIASSKILNPMYIYSFEPLPDCFEELENNTRTDSTIKCFNKALGYEDSMIEFHVNKHRHSSSILTLKNSHIDSFPMATEENVIEVEQTTLDKVFPSLKIKSPALLKIDVQGYETNVLIGSVMSLKEISYVVLEASFKELYKGEKLFLEIVQQMDELGFDFSRPVGFLKDPNTNEILQADALFIRR